MLKVETVENLKEFVDYQRLCAAYARYLAGYAVGGIAACLGAMAPVELDYSVDPVTGLQPIDPVTEKPRKGLTYDGVWYSPRAFGEMYGSWIRNEFARRGVSYVSVRPNSDFLTLLSVLEDFCFIHAGV